MPFSVHDGLPLDLPEKLLRFVTQQHEKITRQQEQIFLQQGQVEAFEAEIHRIKKLPPKPDIKPNTKPPGEGTGTGQPEGNDDNGPDFDPPKRKVNKPDERTRNQRRQPPVPPPEDSLPVAATDVPVGSPEEKTITARPPANLHGHHYGPMLKAYILHQHHGCSVSQPELLDWLWDVGISMSAGELSSLLTKVHDQFHAEHNY